MKAAARLAAVQEFLQPAEAQAFPPQAETPEEAQALAQAFPQPAEARAFPQQAEARATEATLALPRRVAAAQPAEARVAAAARAVAQALRTSESAASTSASNACAARDDRTLHRKLNPRRPWPAPAPTLQ